jgi:hypothetical protein
LLCAATGSALPSITFTSRIGAGGRPTPRFIRRDTASRNASNRLPWRPRVRRLIVDWSGSFAGRRRASQLSASHAQLTGRSCAAAHRCTRTITAVRCT